MPLLIIAIGLALIFNRSIYGIIRLVFGTLISLWVIRAGLIILLLLAGILYLKKSKYDQK